MLIRFFRLSNLSNNGSIIYDFTSDDRKTPDAQGKSGHSNFSKRMLTRTFRLYVSTGKPPLVYYVRRSCSRRRTTESPLPDYDRTRTVTLTEIVIKDVSHVCLQCDCFYFIRHKSLCRHCYAVTNQEPHFSHAFPDCLKVYPAFINKQVEFTERCNKLTDLFISYRGLVLRGTLDEMCKSILANSKQPIDWFLKTKYKIVDANISNGFTLGSGDSDSDSDMLLSDLAPAAKRVRKRAKEMDVYAAHIKGFENCCNAVIKRDSTIDSMFEDAFNKLLTNVLAYQRKENNLIGTATFPNNTRTPNLSRKRPPGSPRKK